MEGKGWGDNVLAAAIFSVAESSKRLDFPLMKSLWSTTV
jgi:hypothetical protein